MDKSSTFLNSLKKKIDKIDISNLRQFMLHLIDEYESLNSVFNSMAEGVIVIDNKNNITFYNKVAARICGIGNLEDESNLKKAINNKRLLTIINGLLKREDKSINSEVKLSDKYYQYVEVNVQNIVKSGKIVGKMVLITDITEKKEVEKKLKQMESLKTLTNITSGVAHEIKNPLGAMSIHLQLIEQDMKKCTQEWGENVKYSLNIVNEEIERLNDIVSNFLTSVRPLKADLMLVDLNEFLDKFIDLVYPELQNKNIKLKRNYSDLPEVWLDENVFKQALINLVQNSIGALEGVDDGILAIECGVTDDYVFIDIIDNGKGIPEEYQTKIFDPYFTTKSQGSGIGLTLVYKIIREHNGYINFTSKPGETVFTIKLPTIFRKDKLIEYDK